MTFKNGAILMSDRHSALGVYGQSLCFAFMAISIVGCGKDADEDADSGKSARPAVTVNQSSALPPFSPWSTQFIGKSATDLFKTSNGCTGAVDVVKVRFNGDPSGVQMAGWSWDKNSMSAPARVLLTNDTGIIIGAADTVMLRTDVPKARSGEVTSPMVGWLGLANAHHGNVAALAVLKNGTVCTVGSKTL